jgi:hypothetical protein
MGRGGNARLDHASIKQAAGVDAFRDACEVFAELGRKK